VGAVERDEILDGSRAQAGDALIGLGSSGIHSNGYSLVRKLVDGMAMDADPGGLGAPLGEVLLRPTRIYVKELLAVRKRIRSAAHITGGGIVGNVPRALPAGLGARIRRGSWTVPPVFDLLRRKGGLSDLEMDRTFNQGLGMVVVAPAHDADALCKELGGVLVGEVVPDDANEVVFDVSS
jgi:phosphoribosylformylglycinamidine cyclo-ligase